MVRAGRAPNNGGLRNAAISLGDRMWEHVELREIRVFLALCEELHFGRTAQRLQISQTRVSQTVRELEHKLGVRLFERTSRRGGLTAARSPPRPQLPPLPCR